MCGTCCKPSIIDEHGFIPCVVPYDNRENVCSDNKRRIDLMHFYFYAKRGVSFGKRHISYLGHMFSLKGNEKEMK